MMVGNRWVQSIVKMEQKMEIATVGQIGVKTNQAGKQPEEPYK